jgi:hypothetical protein
MAGTTVPNQDTFVSAQRIHHFPHDFQTILRLADLILMRVASLEDTLQGKIRAWIDPERRQSKRIKDLGDIARLVESHPELWSLLTDDLKREILPPK